MTRLKQLKARIDAARDPALRQQVLDEIQGKLAVKLTSIAKVAVEGAFEELTYQQAEQLRAQRPEVQAFIALYESLLRRRDYPYIDPKDALSACQQFLRGGAALTAEEILLVQKRATDWFATWNEQREDLAKKVVQQTDAVVRSGELLLKVEDQTC